MPRLRFLPGLIAASAFLISAGCSSTSEAVTETTAIASDSPQTPPIAAATVVARRSASSNPIGAAAPRSGAINREYDVYVLLSGGGTPLSNNYSQYLQARAFAAFFGRECPPERTWVFFGAGNREGAAPVLADVRRELKEDGKLIESWLPGSLPRNRPATRQSLLTAMRDEILPVVRRGGTLYLFVGDHGELSGRGDARESAITLWQLKPSRRANQWNTDESEILGVAELRQVLAAGLGAGRVVFGMTQCHGGGFHELGVAPEMTPPQSWFDGSPPPWAVGSSAGLRLSIAGYTATDEASPAAGCDADPDPERWAGYERFLPEALLGIDLMSDARKGDTAPSLAAAHERATLVDLTIDKPRSTSEHYLESWARLIETRLMTSPGITDATQRAIEGFRRAVDTGEIAVADAGLRERQAQFSRFADRLVDEMPAAEALLRAGTRAQLENAIRAREPRGVGRGPRRGSMAEMRRAWTETLRPAWKSAVLGGQVEDLRGAALAFEKRLLRIEDDGRELLLPRGGQGDALRNEMYWESSYARPATMDPAKAAAVTRWGAERRTRITAWGATSPNPQVREAARKIGPGARFVEEPPQPLTTKTAAERVLFYRRVLAAWEFLITMDATTALTELQQLIALEHTPVRPERTLGTPSSSSAAP